MIEITKTTYPNGLVQLQNTHWIAGLYIKSQVVKKNRAKIAL
jgi:hypothetical protein